MKHHLSDSGYKLFFGIRFQVLLWYVGLMAASTLVSIVATYQVLSTRLEERVNDTLVQEVEKFRRLVEQTQYKSKPSLEGVFDDFLNRNIPNDGVFLLTLLDGKLDQSSPTALPEVVNQNPMDGHWHHYGC